MSKVSDFGYVDLLIKIYLRNFKFPTGGKFTQYIDKLKIGDPMKITAVGGDISYIGNN